MLEYYVGKWAPLDSEVLEETMAFNTRKAAQVVAFFARERGGAIDIIDASKLVYLADRSFLAEFGFTILDDDFFNMEHGPVCSMTYDLMKGNQREEELAIWRSYVADRSGNSLKLARVLTDDDLDELSDAELEALYSIFDQFKDAKPFDIVGWVHKNCPEWVDPGKSSTFLSLKDVFRVLGKDNPAELDMRVRSLRLLNR